jgi:hypothetical protein
MDMRCCFTVSAQPAIADAPATAVGCLPWGISFSSKSLTPFSTFTVEKQGEFQVFEFIASKDSPD